MQLRRKLTSFTKDAPLPAHPLLLRRRTDMPVDTLDILTRTAIIARRHPRHQPQRLQLCRCGLVVVAVRAHAPEGAVPSQEVHVAHLEPLYAGDFLFVVVADCGVDALAFAVVEDGCGSRGEGRGCGGCGGFEWRCGREGGGWGWFLNRGGPGGSEGGCGWLFCWEEGEGLV